MASRGPQNGAAEGFVVSDDETEPVVNNSKKTPPAKTNLCDPDYKFDFHPPGNNPEFSPLTSNPVTKLPLGTSGNEATTNHSSEEEDFEVLNRPEEGGGEVSKENTNPSVPSTPTKLTPHKKRSAQHEQGSSVAAAGSAPGSPVPKKKRWEDYVKEDEAKKSKIPVTTPESIGTAAFSKNKSMHYFIAALLVVVIAVVAVYYIPWTEHEKDVEGKRTRYSWKKVNANFFNWTKELETEFPHQNKETWIQLISSISATLGKTEPAHPATITALFPPTLDDTFASCFLTKVGKIVNKAVAPVLKGKDEAPAGVMRIDPSVFSTKSITEFRTDVEKYFKYEGKVLLTLGIDKLQSEQHLLVFHGLCDNYHAVDKRATLFFPVRVPQDIFQKFEWTHARGSDISNDVLSQAWKSTLSPDSGPALVTRIADAVILLNEGDVCVL